MLCVSVGRSTEKRPLPSTPDEAAAATLTTKAHDERPGNSEYDYMAADDNDYVTTPYTDVVGCSYTPDPVSPAPFYLPLLATPEDVLAGDDLFKEK